MTVKGRLAQSSITNNFSNWIIYVTVKDGSKATNYNTDFSNWIIYVTVKADIGVLDNVQILVTE